MAATLIAGGVFASAVAADDLPPTISNLSITPRKVCRVKSAKCKHPGLTFSFNLSEYSQVTAATSPQDPPRGPVRIFKKLLGAGTHRTHFKLKGLPKGKWQLMIVAVDPSNNSSHPATLNYRIVR